MGEGPGCGEGHACFGGEVRVGYVAEDFFGGRGGRGRGLGYGNVDCAGLAAELHVAHCEESGADGCAADEFEV